MKTDNHIRLIAAVVTEDIGAVRALMAHLTEHEKDLLIPCPVRTCRVAEFEDCTGTDPGVVHFGRRLQRLLNGLR